MFDKNLVSQFHLIDENDEELAMPPVYIAFDCLYRRGGDLRARPLRERRAVLEDEIAGARLIYPALRLDADGLAAGSELKRRGWEGLVAKGEASPYEDGRTTRWLKVKQKDWTVVQDGPRRSRTSSP